MNTNKYLISDEHNHDSKIIDIICLYAIYLFLKTGVTLL